MGVGVLLALSLLLAVAVFVYFELYILRNLQQILEDTVNWIRLGQFLFFMLLTYVSVAILYYLGTIETRKMRFFSPGALMSTLLIFVTTYLFGLYIDNFSTYNQLYGSIGALLIFLLYIWINSNILLLGFELNATITSAKNQNQSQNV